MTVRELIEKLLKCNMEDYVELEVKDNDKNCNKIHQASNFCVYEAYRVLGENVVVLSEED